MFNRRENERLQAANTHLNQRLQDIGPLLPYAELIHTQVEDFTTTFTGGGDALQVAMAGIVNRLSTDARENVVKAVYDALPTERQLELLIKLFGDDEFKQALASKRLKSLEKTKRELVSADKQAIMETLAQNGKEGFVDFRKIPEGLTLVLDFYTEKALYDTTDVSRTIGMGGIRQIKCRSLANGALHAVLDRAPEKVYYYDRYGSSFEEKLSKEQRTNLIPPRSIIEIVTELSDGSAVHTDPVVYYGEVPTIRNAKDTLPSFDLLLGKVIVDQQSLFEYARL